MPALPASSMRAPWAATRKRLQHQGSVPSTPLLQPQEVSSVFSGLPSLSGVGSVPGVACPAYASPSPLTPHACLYPNPQAPLPTVTHEEGKIDFKREKSALPKLNIAQHQGW